MYGYRILFLLTSEKFTQTDKADRETSRDRRLLHVRLHTNDIIDWLFWFSLESFYSQCGRRTRRGCGKPDCSLSLNERELKAGNHFFAWATKSTIEKKNTVRKKMRSLKMRKNEGESQKTCEKRTSQKFNASFQK